MSDSSRKGNSGANAKKIHEYFEPASPARTGYIHSDRQLISPQYANPVSTLRCFYCMCVAVCFQQPLAYQHSA